MMIAEMVGTLAFLIALTLLLMLGLDASLTLLFAVREQRDSLIRELESATRDAEEDVS